MNSDLKVIKKTGEEVLFDETKLISSLQKSGANDQIIKQILNSLNSQLHDGITTHAIYKMAYRLLSKVSQKGAGRYRLKNAIMELGPTGFPFEKFVCAILESQGYKSLTGQVIDGQCVQHEIDVLAENDTKIIIVECKFHQEGNRKSDVKIPLYIRARFDDIEKKWQKEGKLKGKKLEGWLVTNTRFTDDAEKFGTCSGLKLISWDFPHDNNLRILIDKSGLHPITCLKTITQKEKTSIIEQGVVLCKDLTLEILQKIGFSQNKAVKIINESTELLSD